MKATLKLKRITTLNADDRYVDIASKTGKLRGDIYVIEGDCDNLEPDVIWADEWLLCLPAKQLVSFMCHPTVYKQMREYLK